MQHLATRNQVAAAARQPAIPCRARKGTAASPQPNRLTQATLSVYALSDVHTCYQANLAWVRALSNYKHKGGLSCCIVAGDISDDLRIIRDTFTALKAKFDVVAFVPGNHCIWVKSETQSDTAHQQQPYLHSDSGLTSSSSSRSGNRNAAATTSNTSSSNTTSTASIAGSRNAGAVDSVQKLHKVLQLCDECDVIRQPVALGALLLIPLLSWHHKSFDREADIPGVPRAGAMTIADYSACKWPDWMPGSTQLGAEPTAAWFDAANESQLQQPGWDMLQQVLAAGSRSNGGGGDGGSSCSSSSGHTDIISFSHFLPHQHLLPEKRMLTYPNLAKAVGSDFLWSRLQQLQPHLHVFGHTHFAWDMQLAGTRFLQAPLCYPAERQHRMRSIKLNTDEELQEELQQQQQQQQAAVSVPAGHSGSTAQQQQSSVQSSSSSHVRTTSSSSSSGSHHAAKHSSRQHNKPQEQQQHEDPSCGMHWLPVKVYEARFTAELTRVDRVRCRPQQEQKEQQPSQQQAWSTGQQLQPFQLHHAGLPVLCSSQLDAWMSTQQQQQQQQHEQHNEQQQQDENLQEPAYVYMITSWEPSWGVRLHGLWSEYYKTHDRDPNNTELAPWVAKRYKRFLRRRQESTDQH